MDGLNEKKWFFYLGDHHEGPHSVEELKEKLAAGVISQASYVWAEAMPDWKPITEVPELASIFTSAPAEPREPSISPSLSNVVLSPKESTHSQVMPSLAAESPPSVSAPVSPVHKGGSKVKRIVSLLVIGLVVAGALFALMSGMLDPVLQHPSVKPIITQVGDAARPLALKAMDTAPMIGMLISPIPAIEGLSKAEMEDINTAALTPRDQGPRPVVVVAGAETQQPKFVVAGNFPDGAEFEVLVEGVPGQLVDALSYVGRARASLKNRYAISTPLASADGTALPAGKYLVYVYEAETQPADVQAVLATRQPTTMKLPDTIPPGRKLIQKKPVILAAKNDAEFTQNLAAFHQRLKEQAGKELNEIKLWVSTFEGQITLTNTRFTSIKKKKTDPKKLVAKEKADWTKFNDGEWNGFWAQVDQRLATWTPEQLSKMFYGKLYQRTAELASVIKSLHDVHHKFFTAQVDAATVEPTRAQLSAQIAALAGDIKARIAALEQANQASPNGLPQKDQ